MRSDNDEFNPLTEEDEQRIAEEEALDRRIRRMVVRVQSGEEDEQIERDRAKEEAEREAEAEAKNKERKRRQRLSWQIFSGSILTSRGVADNYRYFAVIAVMCLVSIAVMFASLYADLRYSQMESEVQLLRERSIRLQEQLHRQTTHQAVREELSRRGIDLQDPHQTKEILND